MNKDLLHIIEFTSLIEGYLAEQLEESINFCSPAFTELWTFLESNEANFIDLMSDKNPSGEAEFGPALYVLNKELGVLLRKAPFCMPKSKISHEMIEKWEDDLKGSGIVYPNGTIFSFSKFCQFDKNWFTIALAHCIRLRAGFLGLHKYPFQTNPAIIPLEAGKHDEITFAIAGDWGTGFYKDGKVDCPSKLVGDAIDKIGADYTIHLGDVYYSGTNGPLGEEQLNLMDKWKSGKKGSFTFNSNHEMYDGANGYFQQALKSTSNDLFHLQQGTSYFALTFEKWVIIGLDTGYFDPNFTFMDGSIGDSENTQQADFINGLDLKDKRIIVLTHHIPIEFDGSSVNNDSQYPKPNKKSLDSKKDRKGLWDQITLALGQSSGKPRYPDYWYYGHVHNGVAYDENVPALSGIKTENGTTPLMRCNGHGSLPFGKASALLTDEGELKPGVSYMAMTPMPDPDHTQKNRVLNGFATITLSKNKIEEKFFEVSSKEVTMPWKLTTEY